MKVSADLTLSQKLITQIGESKHTVLRRIWRDEYIVTELAQDMAVGLLKYLPRTQKRMAEFLLDQLKDIANYPGGHKLMNANSNGLFEFWFILGLHILKTSPDLSSNPDEPLSVLTGGKTGSRRRTSLASARFLNLTVDTLGGNNIKNQNLFLEIAKEQAEHDDRVKTHFGELFLIDPNSALKRIRSRYNDFNKGR